MTSVLCLILAGNPVGGGEVSQAKIGAWSAYTLSDDRGRPIRWMKFAVVGGDDSGRRRFEIEMKGREFMQPVFLSYDVDGAGRLTRLVLQPGEGAAPLGLPVESGKQLQELRGDKDPTKVRKARLGSRKVSTPVGVINCEVFRSDRGTGCVSKAIQPLGIVELKTAAGERLQLVAKGDDAVPVIVRKVRQLPKHLLGTVDLPQLPAVP